MESMEQEGNLTLIGWLDVAPVIRGCPCPDLRLEREAATRRAARRGIGARAGIR